MSVSIKLARFGAKKAPFYRIVAQTTRSKRDGKSLDNLGWYNPIKKTKQIDTKKYQEWVGKGAIVTKAVKALVEGKTLPKKKKRKKENKKG
jgi:small subunit ribosomal protein S16